MATLRKATVTKRLKARPPYAISQNSLPISLNLPMEQQRDVSNKIKINGEIQMLSFTAFQEDSTEENSGARYSPYIGEDAAPASTAKHQ